MARVDEKIAATAFTVTTPLSFEQVTAQAKAAVEQANKVADKFKVASTKDNRIHFELWRARKLGMGECDLVYKPQPDGRAKVSFIPGHYFRSQTTILYFIPIMPVESPALYPFQRLSAALKERLKRG